MVLKREGTEEGTEEGGAEGKCVGWSDGLQLGSKDGKVVGLCEGPILISEIGELLGKLLGSIIKRSTPGGAVDGWIDGSIESLDDRLIDGSIDTFIDEYGLGISDEGGDGNDEEVGNIDGLGVGVWLKIEMGASVSSVTLTMKVLGASVVFSCLASRRFCFRFAFLSICFSVSKLLLEGSSSPTKELESFK